MTAPPSLLAEIRTAFDDLDAVGLDMLRPLRRRKLGPAEHRRLYREARGKLVRLFALPENDTEPGDSGGSPGE